MELRTSFFKLYNVCLFRRSAHFKTCLHTRLDVIPVIVRLFASFNYVCGFPSQPRLSTSYFSFIFLSEQSSQRSIGHALTIAIQDTLVLTMESLLKLPSPTGKKTKHRSSHLPTVN